MKNTDRGDGEGEGGGGGGHSEMDRPDSDDNLALDPVRQVSDSWIERQTLGEGEKGPHAYGVDSLILIVWTVPCTLLHFILLCVFHW